MGAHLKKVNCCPYIQGWRRSGGYFPKGGTMRLKSSAMQMKTAGRTICQGLGVRAGSAPSCPIPSPPSAPQPHPIPVPQPYLGEEAPGAASGMEHPLDEEGAELLAGERPAPHPVAGLPGHPAQQVRLPGLLRCKGRDGSGPGPGRAGGEGRGLMPGGV